MTPVDWFVIVYFTTVCMFIVWLWAYGARRQDRRKGDDA